MENYWLYRVGIWFVSVAPTWLVHFVASLCVEISFPFRWRTRRKVYANLSHVLPADTPRESAGLSCVAHSATLPIPSSTFSASLA